MAAFNAYFNAVITLANECISDDETNELFRDIIILAHEGLLTGSEYIQYESYQTISNRLDELFGEFI